MTTSLGASEFVELRNGVRLTVRRRPDSPVTVVSAWLLSGSRHERVPGVTHLAEHVLVQAVPPGRAACAVDEVESYGGEVNAVTSREYLVLYARVPTPDAPAALRALADSLTNSAFTEEVVDSERRVVEEELRLAASDPHDIVHDLFFAAAFPGHPLSRPVGGLPGSLAGVRAADLADWVVGAVHAGAVGVVINGDVDAERVAGLLADGPLGGLAATPEQFESAAPGPLAVTGHSHRAMNSDSVAVILGGRGFPLTDRRLAVAEVVLELLAGGNTSTLLEEIRNRRGLSYDVWGFATGYRDIGVWRIGISTAPEHRADVVKLATDLVRDKVARGWTEDAVRGAARRVAGLLRLEAEPSLDEALLLGRHKLVGEDPLWTLQRQLDNFAGITVDEVHRCAEAMFGEMVVVSAGGSPTPQGKGVL